jgi:feruloyl esterase
VALTSAASFAQSFGERCKAFATKAPAELGRIVKAEVVEAGEVKLGFGMRGTGRVPAHCLIEGKINERTGKDGKPYAIGYEVRLPQEWNGRFFFQGGGGMDGVLRPAVGVLSGGAPSTNGLSRGYVVASTDSGHREEPGPFGPYQFGLDPQARLDKGHTSLPPVAGAATAAIQALYGRQPQRRYFVGCSNGGRQAMAVTQLYPELFDGVIAGAPAHRVPFAAIEGMFHNQLLAALAPKLPNGLPDMGAALSKEDLSLLAKGVLESCDAQDGIKDGMVQNIPACRFDPMTLACKPGQNTPCLDPRKAETVKKMFDGARNKAGARIYSAWPYDPGLADPGWTAWRTGTPGANPPNARNATLIPGSIAFAFTAPPDKATNLLAYSLAFDLDRDTEKVKRPKDGFPPGIDFEYAANPDVDWFRMRGGKMIVFHGVSDPIFSALDTADYFAALERRYGSDAASTARLFMIPGMTHCGGGPATDDFDTLTALENWVEKGMAPDALLATARNAPGVPWPGRTRPLCPWPKAATYSGTGDIEKAENFACR